MKQAKTVAEMVGEMSAEEICGIVADTYVRNSPEWEAAAYDALRIAQETLRKQLDIMNFMARKL